MGFGASGRTRAGSDALGTATCAITELGDNAMVPAANAAKPQIVIMLRRAYPFIGRTLKQAWRGVKYSESIVT